MTSTVDRCVPERVRKSILNDMITEFKENSTDNKKLSAFFSQLLSELAAENRLFIRMGACNTHKRKTAHEHKN